MTKKIKNIPYPGKLIKNLNQRLYRLETRGVTEQSQYYLEAEELALKEKYYNWNLRQTGPTVRAINRTQWNKLTTKEQKQYLEMYQGAMQAKTSTYTGIKESQKQWTETYMRHNPKLFEDEERARTQKEREDIIKRNMQKAEQHKEFFQNFWAQMKDHFAYDPETWQRMMNNFDINAMVESGISASRLRDIFNMVKNPQSKHKIPKKYFGQNNKVFNKQKYYGS